MGGSASPTDGNRVLVSTENFTSGTAYAVEDHGESRNAQRVDLWNWDTNPQLNVEVYIGVPPNGPPPAFYYYIRNAYSGLYVTDSYLATAEADWCFMVVWANRYGRQSGLGLVSSFPAGVAVHPRCGITSWPGSVNRPGQDVTEGLCSFEG